MDTFSIIYSTCMITLLLARVPLAIRFLNRENNTTKDLFDYNRAEQFVLVVLWYETEKVENKRMVRILNGMLLLWFSGFMGSIVYLYATGALTEVR
jgi:hypothetical protein